MSTNSIVAIAPFNTKGKLPISSIPIHVILKLNQTLKKSILSRKFYQEINDKILTNASNIDANLYFICYFTLLISSILNNKPKIKHFLLTQRYNLINLLNKVTGKLFGTDLKSSSNKNISKIFNAPAPSKPVENELESSNLAVHLKSISSYLSDIRIFNRLTDSIKYAPWIIDEFQKLNNTSLATSKLNRFIDFAQSINCLILELLENAGWLTDHNWIGTNNNEYWCIETYIWCSRVWGAYIIIEILEMFRRTPISKWDKNWKIGLFKQCIQVPLVVHWSLYEGCLTPFWVGLCGCGASWWGFKDIWSSIDLN